MPLQECLTFLKAKNNEKLQVEKYYFLLTTILWSPKRGGDFISSKVMQCKLFSSASCTLNWVQIYRNENNWNRKEDLNPTDVPLLTLS